MNLREWRETGEFFDYQGFFDFFIVEAKVPMKFYFPRAVSRLQSHDYHKIWDALPEPRKLSASRR